MASESAASWRPVRRWHTSRRGKKLRKGTDRPELGMTMAHLFCLDSHAGVVDLKPTWATIPSGKSNPLKQKFLIFSKLQHVFKIQNVGFLCSKISKLCMSVY
jgi:hypothetical protein